MITLAFLLCCMKFLATFTTFTAKCQYMYDNFQKITSHTISL